MSNKIVIRQRFNLLWSMHVITLRGNCPPYQQSHMLAKVCGACKKSHQTIQCDNPRFFLDRICGSQVTVVCFVDTTQPVDALLLVVEIDLIVRSVTVPHKAPRKVSVRERLPILCEWAFIKEAEETARRQREEGPDNGR